MQRLLKKRLIIVFVIMCLVFVLIGATANENSRVNVIRNFLSVPLKPFDKLISYSVSKVQGILDFFKDVKKIREENEILKERVLELKKENMELKKYKKENEQLRKILAFKDKFLDYETVGSYIIAKEPGNWFHVFTIDKGKKDNLKINDPVITSNGLVGRITHVGLLSSEVVTIIDLDSSVSARLSKTRDLVIVRGDISLKNKGLCRLDYIPPDVDVSVGDMVETSGVGPIYPQGIIIGTIVEIVKSKGKMDSYAVLKPVVDFKRLEEVIVLSKKD